jgi:positive regulator of sigma E activity
MFDIHSDNTKPGEMKKYYRYFTIFVIALYFFLGVFLFISPLFRHLTKEIKIIFAAFLFLYGGYRLARLWSKSREEKEE